MLGELDFRKEADNIASFTEFLGRAGITDAVAPKVHFVWLCTAGHVLLFCIAYDPNFDFVLLDPFYTALTVRFARKAMLFSALKPYCIGFASVLGRAKTRSTRKYDADHNLFIFCFPLAPGGLYS